MRTWLLTAGCTILVCGVLALLYVFDPVTSGVYPPCLFHKLTGLHCPGCGTGRALHHLVHGRIWEAISMNVLAIALAPIALWELIATNRIPANRPFRPIFTTARRVWVLFVAVVVFWIARNIPGPPFSYLAPGGW